jgi:hypothetical protein
MRRKVIFYPLFEDTMAIESIAFDDLHYGASYTHHYTLKTPSAAQWSMSSLLRELADRLDEKDNEPSGVEF